MLITVCSHIYPFQHDVLVSAAVHHLLSALILHLGLDSRCWSPYQLDEGWTCPGEVICHHTAATGRQTHSHFHLRSQPWTVRSRINQFTSRTHLWTVLSSWSTWRELTDARRARTLNTQRPGSELNPGPSSCVATVLATALRRSLLWPPNYHEST